MNYSGPPDNWFPQGRARDAVLPSSCEHLRFGAPWNFESPGHWRFAMAALEKFAFADFDRGSNVATIDFLVLHGVLECTSANAPARFVQEIRKPKKPDDFLVTKALRAANVSAGQGKNGWIGKSGRDFTPDRRLVPFVVVQASVDFQLLEKSPLGPGYENWSTGQRWSWCLTSGDPSLRDTLPPAPDDADAEFATAYVGPFLARAGREGLAFMAAGSGDSSLDPQLHTKLAQLAHLHAVRLVMLHLRQRHFLENHADELAALDWSSKDGVPDSQALELEKRRLRFENKFWFTRLPARPAVTQILGILNSASQMASLREDIAEESSAISRVLDLEKVRLGREAEERRSELNSIVSAFAVAAVFLSLLALLADPSVALFASGLIFSLVTLIWWGWRTKRGLHPNG